MISIELFSRGCQGKRSIRTDEGLQRKSPTMTSHLVQKIFRESFWQHELDTFQPNGLNEHEVALF